MRRGVSLLFYLVGFPKNPPRNTSIETRLKKLKKLSSQYAVIKNPSDVWLLSLGTVM
jgi:hypothetical protein